MYVCAEPVSISLDTNPKAVFGCCSSASVSDLSGVGSDARCGLTGHVPPKTGSKTIHLQYGDCQFLFEAANVWCVFLVSLIILYHSITANTKSFKSFFSVPKWHQSFACSFWSGYIICPLTSLGCFLVRMLVFSTQLKSQWLRETISDIWLVRTTCVWLRVCQ